MNERTPNEVRIEVDGPVRLVTIDRPHRRNTFTDEIHDDFRKAMADVADDRDARVVVLTGGGSVFSYGGDLKFIPNLTDAHVRRRMMRSARHLIDQMVDFPLPVIAAVNGPAVGLGCSLAMLCDIVLMAEDAYLADTHVAVGVVAGDGGALCFPLMTSLLKAKEYLFTGARIPAAKAEALGLANRVYPSSELRAAALTLAQEIGAMPWQALQDTKRAVNLHLKHAAALVNDFAIHAEAESFSRPEFLERIERLRRR